MVFVKMEEIVDLRRWGADSFGGAGSGIGWDGIGVCYQLLD